MNEVQGISETEGNGERHILNARKGYQHNMASDPVAGQMYGMQHPSNQKVVQASDLASAFYKTSRKSQ